jgi:hypothetical protein
MRRIIPPDRPKSRKLDEPPARQDAVVARQYSYRISPNEVTSRSIVDPLRRKDFAYGVVVTPFDEAL